jgi:hypothetical protein
MKISEKYNPSQFESLIFEIMKFKKITIPKKASFWRVVIDDCLGKKSTPQSNKMELTVYLNPLRKGLYLSIGQSYSYQEDSFELLTTDEFRGVMCKVCENYISKTGDEPFDYLSINIEIFWSLVKESIFEKLEEFSADLLLKRDDFWTDQDTVTRMGSRFIFSEYWDKLSPKIQKENINIYTDNIIFDKKSTTSFFKDDRYVYRLELFYKSINNYFFKNLRNLSDETFDIIVTKILYLSTKAPRAKNETIDSINKSTTLERFVVDFTDRIVKRVIGLSKSHNIYNCPENYNYKYLSDYVKLIKFINLQSYFSEGIVTFPETVVDTIVDFGFTPVTIDYFIEFLKLIKNYDLSRLNKTQINIMLLDYYCEEKWKVINILLKTILNATNCMLRVYDTNEKINTDKVQLNFSVNLDSNQTESPNPDDVEIKRLNQLSFVDKIQVLKDKNQIIIYPKNRNANSVVVNNITFTK